MQDVGTACVVGETVGVACFDDVVAETGCADAAVHAVGDVTCGAGGATFAAAPDAFWASAGTLPATGEIWDVTGCAVPGL